MANLMALDSTSGKTAVYTLENSRMGINTVKANGKSYIMPRIVIFMMESTKTIKRMDSVFSNGKVAMCSRVHIRTMKETGMVKCTGLMAATTRVNGVKASNMAWAR